MTQDEQRLHDDKVRAEIAHLNSLTAQAISNLEKMAAETEEIGSRTAKQARETVFYPMVVASGATLAIVAVTKLFL